MSKELPIKAVVIISAGQEWQVVLDAYPQATLQSSPLGQWFSQEMKVAGQLEPVIFFHGGYGKIAAAASAQYTLGRWSPQVLVNLGTCGGFEGDIEKGTIILVERTVVYDIINQIGSAAAAIAQFTTDIDLSWLQAPYPQPVLRTLLVSGDRDLLAEDIPRLKADYGAVAGDWESGAIAWVAGHNNTRCLILRGVSDLVGGDGGEAYHGNMDVFVEGTRRVFEKLLPNLPAWLALALA